MSEDKLIMKNCPSCGFEGFEKSNTAIEMDMPGHSLVLVEQEHFECGRCREAYLTEKQSLEFAKKIEEEKFADK